MSQVAMRFRARGHVQGVFYRAWTRDEARQLGVTGWVRNCDDGSVEAHVEGTQTAVSKLYQLMAKGPSGAKVESLLAEPVEPEGHVGFEVRH